MITTWVLILYFCSDSMRPARAATTVSGFVNEQECIIAAKKINKNIKVTNNEETLIYTCVKQTIIKNK